MYEGHRIVHYYHIYANGAWHLPLQEHLAALTSSGLCDHIDAFNIGLVGSPERRDIVIQFLEKSECEFNIVVESDTGWEQETLDRLYEESVSSFPFKVLYAHTKGAAHPSRVSTIWRQDMTEGVVGRWETAAKLLDDHDAVGIFWLRDRKIFGGNFWWANSSYLATLGYPHRKDRFSAESWLRHKDGLDALRTTNIRIVDLHPGFRLGLTRRQVFKEAKPKFMKHTQVSGESVRVRFLRKVSGYKVGQVVTFEDGVFLRAIIKGGSAGVLDPIDWTPEKADERRLEKERNEESLRIPE